MRERRHQPASGQSRNLIVQGNAAPRFQTIFLVVVLRMLRMQQSDGSQGKKKRKKKARHEALDAAATTLGLISKNPPQAIARSRWPDNCPSGLSWKISAKRHPSGGGGRRGQHPLRGVGRRSFYLSSERAVPVALSSLARTRVELRSNTPSIDEDAARSPSSLAQAAGRNGFLLRHPRNNGKGLPADFDLSSAEEPGPAGATPSFRQIGASLSMRTQGGALMGIRSATSDRQFPDGAWLIAPLTLDRLDCRQSACPAGRNLSRYRGGVYGLRSIRADGFWGHEKRPGRLSQTVGRCAFGARSALAAWRS